MNRSGNWIISCGMYAFTEPLRRSWQTLLEPLPGFLDASLTGADNPEATVVFDCSDETYLSPDLLIGHTCGYPYLKRWQATHEPVAVPVFDIPGCDGTGYRSWFICRADDERDSLAEFSQGVVALNHADSNSGMNVLRYALKDLSPRRTFFRRVLNSGSHTESMRLVARGEADLAAIDAVSFHHVAALEPSLAGSVRVFSRSATTTGLPFIRPRESQFGTSRILQALNEALTSLPAPARDTLRLTGFSPVEVSDYERTQQMEHEAILAGYPVLK